jgi:outer membrane protein, multidrug efflux system
MTAKTLLLLTLSIVFLTGCTMIPAYTRPEAPIPDSWPTDQAYKPSSSPLEAPLPADLKWQDFFKDEQVQALIATALKNNRDLRIAALNVEKARALYRIQGEELLPTVDATGRGLKEKVPGKISGTERSVIVTQYRADLGVSSWEIDFFGRIRSLEARALEEYLATEQARRSAQILLISEVANAYLTLAADRENLKLARNTLETQKAAYNLIRRRFEVGLVPELDLRQVQTRVDSARVDVARFTELVSKDQNALNLLVGSSVPDEWLPATLSAVAPLPDVSPGTSSEVLLRRPDVLQAENLLRAANANIGAARAAFFPRITLTGAVGTASGELADLFEHGSFYWTFTPQIVLPIFDPRIWSALTLSEVQMDLVLTSYERTVQAAFRDVADALAQKGTLEDQLQAQQSLVDATRETYRLSNARYEKGIDIYLNVLDAQRSLYAAQQGLISIHLTKFTNQVRLYAVLGGGAI